MKKSIIIITSLILASIAFQQPKTYTLKFTDNQLQQLYFCLDKSEASHTVVAELQAEIQRQYQAQLIADSTKKPKP